MHRLSAHIAEIFGICELDAYTVSQEADRDSKFLAKLNDVINAKNYFEARKFAASKEWKMFADLHAVDRGEAQKIYDRMNDAISNMANAENVFTKKQSAMVVKVAKLLA